MAQAPLSQVQARSGLYIRLISTYLCNPFQDCFVVVVSLSTGAPFGGYLRNDILPIPGKILKLATLPFQQPLQLRGGGLVWERSLLQLRGGYAGCRGAYCFEMALCGQNRDCAHFLRG